ncbi:hypothetical protein RSOLAG1IB_02979 [Rhizoctonia solani AG-1 IB]|uniref:Uncharacterized protein n=1 Tax=Thanatephorus cucumeris (strain AG1-IB / isolate 7/3/14) TaxID=1108050 RepID=A0A0B7FPS1_THACB|nr:hypothetical protein RSOLAG1IB_02979 [Rhizoctonia solani AG-1 IB]
MGTDTKSELEANLKVLPEMFSPEIKAEVTALVQAALSKIQPLGFEHSIDKNPGCVVQVSSTDVETEAERKYRGIVSALEAKLSESDRQLEGAYRDLSDAQDQLEKQRAKSVQLEQRILQMSEVEGTLKSALAAFRAERDHALSREREALMCRDRAGMHNAQLSNQISELQGELDLKDAQLNDASYNQQQLESRINELKAENVLLRQSPPQGIPTGVPAQSGATTSPQTAQPPSSLYFSVPVAHSVRRHTAPNILPAPAPTIPNSRPVIRPPKRARVDPNASITSDSTQPQVSSGNSGTFALRPVKSEHSHSTPLVPTMSVPPSNQSSTLPRYKAYSPVSPTAPVSPYHAEGQVTCASPTRYQNQPLRQAHPSAPQAPSSSAPITTTVVSPSVTRPPGQALSSNPTQTMQPTPQWAPHAQQFINQMFALTLSGFLECKICKVQPLGHLGPKGGTTPPTISDLLTHAEQYHGKTMVPTQQQTQP